MLSVGCLNTDVSVMQQHNVVKLLFSVSLKDFESICATDCPKVLQS